LVSVLRRSATGIEKRVACASIDPDKIFVVTTRDELMGMGRRMTKQPGLGETLLGSISAWISAAVTAVPLPNFN
jgi:hypothetical protein